MRMGLHQPGIGFTERAKAASRILNQVFLWLTSENIRDALLFPDALHIVRLPTPLTDEMAGAYVARVAPIISTWQAAGLAHLYFQPGNEPDIQADGDVPVPWTQMSWLAFMPSITSLLRASLPGIRLAAPAFSVANTGWVTLDYLRLFDLDTCHSYWDYDVPEDITNSGLGASYMKILSFGSGNDLVVTEVNAVLSDARLTQAATDPTVWAERNNQLVQWIMYATTAGVGGFCLFMADGASAGWPRYDVGPEAANDVYQKLNQPLPHPPDPPNPPAPIPPPAPDILSWVPPAQDDFSVPDPPRLFDRSDYGWREMAIDQYYACVDDGSFPGRDEVMRNEADYSSLVTALRPRNIDPYFAMASAKAEGHDMTDPGLVAAPYNNPAGVKYTGAPGEYDTGIPADTGGTYAGYPDLAVFWNRWADIMNNSIIGPDFQNGNLYGAVEHYTNGPRTGWLKVTFWVNYLQTIAAASLPSPVVGIVTGPAVVARALMYDGDSSFVDEGETVGSLERCEEFVEVVHEVLGIPRVRWYDAVQHGRAITLVTDPAGFKPGMVGFFDERFFYPDGHTAIYMGNDQFIGAGGSTVHVTSGWLEATGFMGMAFYPGVGEVVEDIMFTVDNRIDEGRLDANWFGTPTPTATAKRKMPRVKGHGIPDRWEREFRAGRGLGAAKSPEMAIPGASGAVIQYFANGWICWYPDGTTTVN